MIIWQPLAQSHKISEEQCASNIKQEATSSSLHSWATVTNFEQQDSSPEQICLHFEIHRSGNSNRNVCGQMHARTSPACYMAEQYVLTYFVDNCYTADNSSPIQAESKTQ